MQEHAVTNAATMTDSPLASADANINGKRAIVCAVSGKTLRKTETIALGDLRPALADRIRVDYPAMDDSALLSRKAVDEYRSRYISELLEAEHGESTTLDREVAASIAKQDTIAMDTDDEFDEHRTFGERMADAVASFGGSWTFIIFFFLMLSVWMAINVVLGEANAFDAYPFILLNLVLSCLAAIQAPIIMMSQKRQDAKDRLRSQSDYRVNLKAELEIRHLHEKMDHLVIRQWQRLAEIQQLQVELLQEIRVASAKPKRKKRAAKPAKAASPA
jgi:uncharacterized membrane protein